MESHDFFFLCHSLASSLYSHFLSLRGLCVLLVPPNWTRQGIHCLEFCTCDRVLCWTPGLLLPQICSQRCATFLCTLPIGTWHIIWNLDCNGLRNLLRTRHVLVLFGLGWHSHDGEASSWRNRCSTTLEHWQWLLRNQDALTKQQFFTLIRISN